MSACGFPPRPRSRRRNETGRESHARFAAVPAPGRQVEESRGYLKIGHRAGACVFLGAAFCSGCGATFFGPGPNDLRADRSGGGIETLSCLAGYITCKRNGTCRSAFRAGIWIHLGMIGWRASMHIYMYTGFALPILATRPLFLSGAIRSHWLIPRARLWDGSSDRARRFITCAGRKIQSDSYDSSEGARHRIVIVIEERLFLLLGL